MAMSTDAEEVCGGAAATGGEVAGIASGMALRDSGTVGTCRGGASAGGTRTGALGVSCSCARGPPQTDCQMVQLARPAMRRCRGRAAGGLEPPVRVQRRRLPVAAYAQPLGCWHPRARGRPSGQSQHCARGGLHLLGWAGCSPQGRGMQAWQPTHCPPPAAGLAWWWVPRRRRICPGRPQRELGVRRGWTGCSPPGPGNTGAAAHALSATGGCVGVAVGAGDVGGFVRDRRSLSLGFAGAGLDARPRVRGNRRGSQRIVCHQRLVWRGGGCRDVGGFVRDGSSLSLEFPGAGLDVRPKVRGCRAVGGFVRDGSSLSLWVPGTGLDVRPKVRGCSQPIARRRRRDWRAGGCRDDLGRFVGDGSSLSLGWGRFSAGRRFAEGG